jgi:N-acetylmuramoyl-L-alanine amidase
MDIGVKEVRQWHKARGWKDVGYHYIIRRNGKVEAGRRESQVGAHVAGHNADSIGISLAGGINERTLKPESNYTPAQWASLDRLIGELSLRYPDANVTGHRDFPGVAKACPCFDAEPWAVSMGFKTKGRRTQATREIKGSRTIAGASIAAVGGAGEMVSDTANQLSPLTDYSGVIRAVFVALLVAGVALTIYARWSDAKANPKFNGDAPEDDSK